MENLQWKFKAVMQPGLGFGFKSQTAMEEYNFTGAIKLSFSTSPCKWQCSGLPPVPFCYVANAVNSVPYAEGS